MYAFFFFFNDTATTEIYTLSLHDALPIWVPHVLGEKKVWEQIRFAVARITVRRLHPKEIFHTGFVAAAIHARSEEHTSELQSQSNLVCRLLLEKKKNNPAGAVTDKFKHEH